MIDEKSQIAKELISPNEAMLAHEAERYPELISPEENIAALEANNAKVKEIEKNNRQRALKALTGTFVTAGAAATFGVTTLINVNMSAEFKQAYYQDGVITYQVNVEDMSKDQTLFLHFYDGKEELDTYDLSKDALEAENGVFEGEIWITPEMLDNINAKIVEKNTDVTFNLTLTGNVGLSVERTFDNYAIQFYHAESVFEKVEGECHCGIDGYYYFTLIYKDDYGIFSDFQAYIEDAEGNISECTTLDSTNAHEQHRISVANMKSSICTLVVSYIVRGEETPRVVETTINL